MPRLDQLAQKVRSKNAGPFWLTVDLFCGSDAAFTRVCAGLSSGKVAQVLNIPVDDIKRFEMAELNVVKLSFPRPVTQGHILDRDLHGASWAALLGEVEIN